MKNITATVISNRSLQGDYRILTLKAKTIASRARPGQFVHLRVPNLHDASLRRPFSIYKAANEQLSLLYKQVGRGTLEMAKLRQGDTVELLGPLGNGFPAIQRARHPVLIAGGYGTAALYLLAQRSAVKGDVFVGGGEARDILCVNDFRKIGWRVHIATEDGSRGARGLVTDPLDSWLQKKTSKQQLVFFACGPMGMLQAVGQRAQDGNWPAWLSLDRRMGCGMGACLACVQKVKTAISPENPDGWQWKRVCVDGPVFESRKIIWDNNSPSPGSKPTSNKKLLSKDTVCGPGCLY